MKLSPYLPSKKVKIIIAVIAIALLSVMTYTLLKKSSPEVSSENFIDVIQLEKNSESNYIDSDNDGVYDWEENLWPELDPNNPDSDGDGVSDKKYLDNKKNILERTRTGTPQESNLTETEKLARSTLTAVLAVYESGEELDADSQQIFAENINEYVSNLYIGESLYTRDQLNLVPDTRENIEAYQKEMESIFRSYPIEATDIELIIQASENPEDFSNKMKIAASKYENYEQELKNLSVPYVLGGRHTELSNAIGSIHGAFDNLLSDEIDELVSLAAIVQIEDIMTQSVGSIIFLNNFFEATQDDAIFSDQIE